MKKVNEATKVNKLMESTGLLKVSEDATESLLKDLRDGVGARLQNLGRDFYDKQYPSMREIDYLKDQISIISKNLDYFKQELIKLDYKGNLK